MVIMISTLSAIGWPSYTKARIKAENKEAFSILFLLQSAEKNYKLDSQGNTFYPPPTDSVTDVSSINSNLNVHLSETATRHWNYTVYSSGCVQVTRKNDGTRVWHLNISISDYITPVSGACS